MITVEGKALKEIAEMCGRSVRTIQGRYQAARKRNITPTVALLTTEGKTTRLALGDTRVVDWIAAIEKTIGKPVIQQTVYSFVYHHRAAGRSDQDIIKRLLERYNIDITKD